MANINLWQTGWAENEGFWQRSGNYTIPIATLKLAQFCKNLHTFKVSSDFIQ